MTPTPITPSRWRRFACMMYESILLFGIIFIASYLFDTLTQSRSGIILRHSRQLVLFLALGLYFLLCWSRKGQTLAMKTWHIRLVDASGKKPSIALAAFRFLLIWPIPLLGLLAVYYLSSYTGYASTDLLGIFAPCLIFVWSWFDKDQQFLHDRLLGTRLISVSPAKNIAAR